MKWLIAGNFLIALISISLSAFVFKELKPSDFVALDKRITTSEDKVSELSVTVKNMTGALKDKQVLLKEMENQQISFYRDIDLRNEVIDREILSIKQRIKNDPEVILLLEIEYLIRSANQKSVLERNLSAAIFLMKEASVRLENNSNLISEAASIEDAIDRDIRALETIDLPDISKVYQEINGIVDRLTYLKFPVDKKEQPQNARNPSDSEPSFDHPNTDSVFLDILFAQLSKLVEFGKVDNGLKPVITAKEDYFLRQRISTNLNIAQLSLLKGNNAIFQESLAEAKEILTSYFRLNEELASIHADLKALDNLLIEKHGPPLSRSLNYVRNSINKLINRE